VYKIKRVADSKSVMVWVKKSGKSRTAGTVWVQAFLRKVSADIKSTSDN